KEAFARSCNDTFINIAKDLGGDTVVRYAKKFGLGKGLDIGLGNDDGGLPDSQVFAGAGIGNLAIGQGDVMATPLQMADVIATIVNGGVRKPLRLIDRVISNRGDILEVKEENEEYRVLSQNTSNELVSWLSYAAEHGTGKRAYDESYGGCGGKTGTPQINYDPKANYYGWFVGYFPKDDPKYAMAVLSREQGEGGATAAPIFRKIAKSMYK
ncbi:MAG: hypothetical protein GX974_05300, partial [Clostridiales bacterium]|nr:hypothetical protein [Clostridiales bacterium]